MACFPTEVYPKVPYRSSCLPEVNLRVPYHSSFHPEVYLKELYHSSFHPEMCLKAPCRLPVHLPVNRKIRHFPTVHLSAGKYLWNRKILRFPTVHLSAGKYLSSSVYSLQSGSLR